MDLYASASLDMHALTKNNERTSKSNKDSHYKDGLPINTCEMEILRDKRVDVSLLFVQSPSADWTSPLESAAHKSLFSGIVKTIGLKEYLIKFTFKMILILIVMISGVAHFINNKKNRT